MRNSVLILPVKFLKRVGEPPKNWTVEGGGRFTENFLGLLTHIEEQGSLQLDPPAPWRVKICTVVARIGAPWCVTHLVRHALKHSKTQ